MRWVWLSALLAIPAGDDKAAQDLLRAVRERIDKARTVRIEGRIAISSGDDPLGEAAISLRFRGRDRWALEVRPTQPPKDSVEGREVQAYCDGRKILLAGAPAGAGLSGFKPEEGADILRWSVAAGAFSDLERSLSRNPEDFFSIPVAPVVADVRDGGLESIGGVEARIVECAVRQGGWKLSPELSRIRLFIDSGTRRVLRKESTTGGLKTVETFTVFAFDEDLPDSDFSFESPRRLARVRAEQLARSVELYGRFTGRYPRSLEDLIRRPAHLEPEVFWPEGGFVLGGQVPRDPWGRPYQLTLEGGSARITGTQAAGDIEVPLRPVTRRPVGAPTARLQEHFTSRVQLQLLANAVRAFRDATGGLPRRKAALWEKPDDCPAWPEGGWLPGGRMPLDPWGEPYRMISDPDTVRLQVRDPEARRLSARLLSAEETRRLEEIGQPRLSEEERRGVGALLDRLSEDDLDAREKAVAELRGWGAAILTVLDERLKLERDPEVRLRVEGIRKALPFPRSAWPREILPLAVTVGRSENLRDLEADLSTCQNHLSQLWKMEWVYASQFGGRMKRMPEATGKEFWLALAKTQPPLIDESSREIFLCVSQTADARPGTCSYRGPAVSVARLADGDAVGLCDDESHQDRAVVLRKSGEAVIVSRSDPEYERALQTTKP